MKAISVRQPWATLIATGKKKIEYRTWKVNYRGDLLIVASAGRYDDDCRDQHLDPADLAYGTAICVVELWKITGSEGDYRWHVRDPRGVEAVPVKGFAAIYHVEDALIRPVAAGKARKATTKVRRAAD